MKVSITAAFLALVLGTSLAACSSSSSSSTSTSTDNSASSAAADNSGSTDNSASSGATDNSASSSADSSGSSATGLNGVGVYPGAVPGSAPTGMGTPPPDAKVFTTGDDVKKVEAWYTANSKAKTVMSDPKMGTIMLVGDPKTGTAVLILNKDGKTYIAMTSAANMK